MMGNNVGSKLAKMNHFTGTTDNANGICEDFHINTTACSEKVINSLWSELGVSRVMFGGTTFFALMGVAMVGAGSSGGGRGTLQNGLWGVKVLLIAAFAAGAFFIPNLFFAKPWAVVGVIGGFVWTLAQLVLIIDFAYSWADSWIAKIEDGSALYKWLTILASLGMYIFSLTMIVVMYSFYTKPNDSASSDHGCGHNKFFITMDLLFSIAITCLALSGRVQEAIPNSGLLQAGVVVSYVTYYTWSGVSQNDQACTPTSAGISDHTASVVGAMFTFAAVCYASLRTAPASSVGKLGMNTERGDDDEKSSLTDNTDLENGSDDEEREDDEAGAVRYNWCYFHLTFALACLYLMEVMTDWGAIRDGATISEHIGRGKASVWLNIISSWLSALLYMWTLAAPIIMTNRDFD
jgi:hypothetical protein